MNKLCIAITGANGLVGKALAISLAKQGHDVLAFVRNPAKVDFLPPENVIQWDGKSPPHLNNASKNINAFVHLAGESVATSRWNEKRKEEILSSRVNTTNAVVDFLASLPATERPEVAIFASAIGYYGDQGSKILDESSESKKSFLSDVTVAWENASQKTSTLGIRQVTLRIGVVLSREGGALDKMQPVTLGSGDQWLSWIHIDDLVGFIEHAILEKEAQGVYNLTAPEPAQNRDFSVALGKTIQFPINTSIPSFILKTALGEMSEMLLMSQRVLPKRALEFGYHFKFSSLSSALKNLFLNQNYLDYYFEQTQFIPQTKDTVFSFFSQAENLEALTPRWLNFKIKKKSTPAIEKNTKIDYQISLHGIPMNWRTLIEEWVPKSHFVDSQLKGPYKKWRHEHQFFELSQGTLMVDKIVYRLPGLLPGKLGGSAYVKSEVKKIFDYRRKAIQERFK